MGEDYELQDSTWDDHTTLESLLGARGRARFTDCRSFFFGAYSISPLRNSPNICLGDGIWGGAGEWGIHLVAAVGTGAEGPHSPNCPYFSPCLSFLSSGLANQSGASAQIPWRLILWLPAPGQWRMPGEWGESLTAHLAARSCRGNRGLKSFIPRLPALCPALHLGHRVPLLHVLGVVQGELSLLMNVCPLCQHFRCASSALPCQMCS